MKAIVYDRYGPPEVLHLADVARPAPKDDEVLIEVRAVAATSGDARMRGMNLPPGFGVIGRLVMGVRGPRRRILGGEVAGVVAAVGTRVTRFQVGAPVFAATGMRMGGYAELCAVPEAGAIASKPANLTFEQAAALSFGGTTALEFFRRGKLRAGERILINGASGAVGTAAVQLAKHLGAHVTAVCSAANFELVRSLGADAVIDYHQEDFTARGETYDLVMDNAGTAPFARSRKALRPGGRLLVVLGGLGEMFGAIWHNLTSGKRVIAGPAVEKAADLQLLAELAEQGKYRPVIDRRYPLERAAEAHAYVDTGRKKGNVILTVGGESGNGAGRAVPAERAGPQGRPTQP